MNFSDITTISEGYNYQNDWKIKVQKDESEYYHYTTPEKFCKIVKVKIIRNKYEQERII